MVIAFLVHCAAVAEPAPLILSNLQTLLNTRARIAAGDPSLAHAVTLMRADAEAAMGPNAWTIGTGPWSVMNKSLVAASGDKHDYFSTAKYCWPCNTECNATVEKETGNSCDDWLRAAGPTITLAVLTRLLEALP